MKLLNDRPLVSGLAIGFLVGLVLGWFVIGWGLWPVKWKDTNPSMLREDFKKDYVQMTAVLYSYTLDDKAASDRMREWPEGDKYICQLANETSEGIAQQNLLNLAQVVSPGIDCTEVEETPLAEEGSPLIGQIALLCGVGLLAAAVVGVAIFFISRQREMVPPEPELAEEEPAVSVPTSGGRTIPLAQFPTEFNIGYDTYDDSFSIETASGEFLGECGVGISESIGIADPKKVTAFEVWLFDKNDIRTVTKVIMSEHAYHDDALRAKLAPKGEAVLARSDETIVLETASLIINARIVEMEYGSSELPPQSFFNRLVIELAAWAKEEPEAAAEAPEANQGDFAL